MRVAIVNIAPHDTGVGKYSLKMYELLRERIDIDYYFLNHERQRLEIWSKEGKRMIPIGIKRRILFTLKAKAKIPKGYDLYHLTSQELSFLNLRPKIVTCHDLIRLLYPRSTSEYLKQFIFYSGLKRADHLLANSQYTKHDLIIHKGVHSDHITVALLGVDHSLFKKYPAASLAAFRQQYELSEKRRYLLHISTEEPRKGFAELLHAFEKIKDDIPDCDILKVGRSFKDCERKHSSLAEKLNIKNRVIRIGQVPEEDLPFFYSLATAVVLPSRYEGFGLPVLEAMACGSPVIAYNNSSIPEIASEVLVTDGDKDALARAMLSVMTDSNLRARLAEEGVKRAQLFSWEACANTTLTAYFLTIRQKLK